MGGEVSLFLQIWGAITFLGQDSPVSHIFSFSLKLRPSATLMGITVSATAPVGDKQAPLALSPHRLHLRVQYTNPLFFCKTTYNRYTGKDICLWSVIDLHEMRWCMQFSTNGICKRCTFWKQLFFSKSIRLTELVCWKTAALMQLIRMIGLVLLRKNVFLQNKSRLQKAIVEKLINENVILDWTTDIVSGQNIFCKIIMNQQQCWDNMYVRAKPFIVG